MDVNWTAEDVATEEGRMTVLQGICEIFEETVAALYSRWLNEREYEDFADYAKVMKNLAGECFVKATKRPFGLVLNLPHFPYDVNFYVNSRSFGCKAVKKS